MNSSPSLPIAAPSSEPEATPAALPGPLQALLAARPVAPGPAAVHGVLTGTLDGFDELDGTPLVRFPGATAAVRARTVVPLRTAMTGEPVVLVFDGGDIAQPIVLGVLQAPQPGADGVRPADELADRPRRLVLEAQDEIVLRNRHAKIRLSAEGDVEIVGTSFTTRSQRLLRLLSPLIKLN